MKLNNLFAALGLARIALGLTFLWAFFDKLLGLGFATCRDTDTNAVTILCEKAWLQGGSPTSDFLQFAAKGPFSDLYALLAQNTFIDTLFMLGLLGIGLALTLGIAVKLATITGSLLMFMMYTAVLPPDNHPFIDQHIIYIIIFVAIYFADDQQRLGLGNRWRQTALVKRLPWLG